MKFTIEHVDRISNLLRGAWEREYARHRGHTNGQEIYLNSKHPEDATYDKLISLHLARKTFQGENL